MKSASRNEAATVCPHDAAALRREKLARFFQYRWEASENVFERARYGKGPHFTPRAGRNWRPDENSLGQPLSATPEGLRSFWDWFGDSCIVDEEGRPLVVWVGGARPAKGHEAEALTGVLPAGSNTRVFLANREGMTRFHGPACGYCFGDEAVAKADAALASAYLGGDEVVHPVYIRLVNPMMFDGPKKEFTSSCGEFTYSLSTPADQLGEAIAAIHARGHDGTITNSGGGFARGHVLGLSQVKGVENRGAFDPDEESIFG